MALKLEKLAQPFQVSIHVLPCHPCNRLCSDYLSRFRIEIDTNKTTSRRREILFQTQNGLK